MTTLLSGDLKFKHFLGGKFISDKPTYDVLNPSNRQNIGQAPSASESLVGDAVLAAKKAQTEWSRLPANARGVLLKSLANLIRENLPRLSQLVSLEQGKVPELAQMEVGIAAEYLDYMAGWGRRIEGEVISSDRPGETMLMFRRPMGVIAAVLPWNFPFFMVARKMAPALITGNTIVVKPSEETPFCAAAFAELVAQTEIPDGVFNMVGGERKTGELLVANPDIDMISFTGSSAAGSAIMQAAGRNLTKVNLELGGKAPAIIMDDANIDIAAATLAAGKSINTGQACNCAERIYVHKDVSEKFNSALVSAMRDLTFGDPMSQEGLSMGPLINQNAVKRLEALVENAKSNGADILLGGKAEDETGCHFSPTILSKTNKNMDIMTAEVFGPVFVVDEIDSLDEGISRANDSEYGLTSSIFTNNLTSAMTAINELKFGETYVNRENFEAIQGFHAGVKKSGIGGTDGKHGLYEYTHTQVAYIQI